MTPTFDELINILPSCERRTVTAATAQVDIITSHQEIMLSELMQSGNMPAAELTSSNSMLWADGSLVFDRFVSLISGITDIRGFL